MKKKKEVFLWYSEEAGGIFELGLDASLNLMAMIIKHDFNFNRTIMFLGRL